MILVLDNYDSFTFNLVQYLLELGAEVQVKTNDALSVEALLELDPQGIMVSPGPSNPGNAGVSVPLILAAAEAGVPLLGVCLGHQSIAVAFGGVVAHATRVMHGKVSPIHHQGQGVFRELPSPFLATRYHSLSVERGTLPDCLEESAWTLASEEGLPGDPLGHGEIMGLRHKQHPIEGVQFHPESILSEQGHALLRNWLDSLAG